MMTDEVLICKKDSTGWDEQWCEWFTCPSCKEKSAITEWFNYCPNCGIKIKFNKEEK